MNNLESKKKITCEYKENNKEDKQQRQFLDNHNEGQQSDAVQENDAFANMSNISYQSRSAYLQYNPINMRKYQFQLSIAKIKEYKHQLSVANYYLCIENSMGERQVTSTRNIVVQCGLFTFAVSKQIKSVQIWHYDKQKKVGTVMLKRQKPTCIFAYQFKNFNLRLTIKSFNLVLDTQITPLFSKEHLKTADSDYDINTSQQCSR